jgi:hypothetical protein
VKKDVVKMSIGYKVANLEQECASYAIDMAQDVRGALRDAADVLITKALGVLQEQGLYALALFCAAASDKEQEGAGIIIKYLSSFFKEHGFLAEDAPTSSPRCFATELAKEDGLLSKLDDLTLAIFLAEKTLVYARYYAKALKKKDDEEKQESSDVKQ